MDDVEVTSAVEGVGVMFVGEGIEGRGAAVVAPGRSQGLGGEGPPRVDPGICRGTPADAGAAVSMDVIAMHYQERGLR